METQEGRTRWRGFTERRRNAGRTDARYYVKSPKPSRGVPLSEAAARPSFLCLILVALLAWPILTLDGNSAAVPAISLSSVAVQGRFPKESPMRHNPAVLRLVVRRKPVAYLRFPEREDAKDHLGEGATDGTSQGVNISALDTAQTANLYVCPYSCGSPGPYPDTPVTPPSSSGININGSISIRGNIVIQ